jgi:dihydroorotate dehydrogenase electron transfer subunit
MIQTQVTLVGKAAIAPAWWQLTLAAPDLISRLIPCQFLLLRCADRFTCYLRRPIFPAPVGSDHFTLLLQPDSDPGLAWLLSRVPGERLDVIGPLGTGFPLPGAARNLLLVSDVQAISPLLGQMSRAIEAGIAVTLALGASRAATLYPLAALPPVVEFQAATLDGSCGQRGSITELLPGLLSWADAVCAVGSTGLYHALKNQTIQARFGAVSNFAYGLVTPHRLACGVGACQSCAIPTATGVKLTCADGPIFDLATLDV